MEKTNHKDEIDIITDTLTVLLVILAKINRGEVTQYETEEMLNTAMGVLYPLTNKRNKELARMLH